MSKLHMSLDEIAREEKKLKKKNSIKRYNNNYNNRKGGGGGGSGGSGGSGGGGSGGSGGRKPGGPIRRTKINRMNQRKTPYARNSDAVDGDKWDHDGFAQQTGQKVRTTRKPPNIIKKEETIVGTKVRITNLKYDVLENDLKDLMSKIGPVSSIKIYYDRNTKRSLGKADIIFLNQDDAERAVQEYNEASIEGQVMQVYISGRPRVPLPILNNNNNNNNNSNNSNNNNNNSNNNGNSNNTENRIDRRPPKNNSFTQKEKANDNDMDIDPASMKIQVSFDQN